MPQARYPTAKCVELREALVTGSLTLLYEIDTRSVYGSGIVLSVLSKVKVRRVRWCQQLLLNGP